ncbi:unnamed protein product [Calypogeia fissa]
MGKARDVMRPVLFVIAVFVLQVPLFIAISKLIQLKGQQNKLISNAASAGQAFLSLGSFQHITNPSKFEIETSSILSSSSSGSSPDSGQSSINSDDTAFKPLSYANYPFVLFSGYRHTLNSFYVLGITSIIVRSYENEQPVYRCEWVPNCKSDISNDKAAEQTSQKDDDHQQEGLLTEADMLYVRFDENGMVYVPAIVNCTFNQSVGADGEGGLLRLHLSRGPSFWGPHYAVGDVFREMPLEVNEKSKSWLQQDHNAELSVETGLPYKYAFCGPPLYGTTHNREWIPKWLAYHHYLWEGKEHFYFYVAEPLNTEARQMLEPWIKAGLLTIIEAVGGEAYPSWYRNQLLFINDCIYRTRFTAQWTFFHDLDELLYVPAPNTLAGLLEEHRDKPWMTFGNLPFSLDFCTTTNLNPKQQQQTQKQRELSSDDDQSSQIWQLERLQWRSKHPECRHEDEDPWMCIAAPGRRKYVVNPRKVFVSGVHRVAMPETGGVNFNASIARVHHFHGITNPNRKACSRLVNVTGDSEQPDPLSHEFDNAMASLVPEVRKFAGPLLLPP